MESLAVKYRPRVLEDVVGQENVKVVLQGQIQNKAWKQGYLFVGNAGCGKTTTARILARTLNEGKGNPIEIDGASNNGVDNVREIIEDCKMKPVGMKYKVYIIDEVHMLSRGAFNALLKVLEEPPKGVVFILCTTEPEKILTTIKSRLQRFDFKPIPVPQIVDRLMYILDNENNHTSSEEVGTIKYDEDALQYIAKLANGGMRDAITKLDTVLGGTKEVNLDNVMDMLGVADLTDIHALVSYVIKGSAINCMEVIADVVNDGKNLKQFVDGIVGYLVDVMKFSYTKDIFFTSLPSNFEDRISKMLSYANSNNISIVSIMDEFMQLNNAIKYEENPRVYLEAKLIVMCN